MIVFHFGEITRTKFIAVSFPADCILDAINRIGVKGTKLQDLDHYEIRVMKKQTTFVFSGVCILFLGLAL